MSVSGVLSTGEHGPVAIALEESHRKGQRAGAAPLCCQAERGGGAQSKEERASGGFVADSQYLKGAYEKYGGTF